MMSADVKQILAEVKGLLLECSVDNCHKLATKAYPTPEIGFSTYRCDEHDTDPERENYMHEKVCELFQANFVRKYFPELT